MCEVYRCACVRLHEIRGFMNTRRVMSLFLVVCVGLVFCSVLFFRGDLDSQIETLSGVNRYFNSITTVALKDAVQKAAYGSFAANSYVRPVALPQGAAAPDALSGATPRIINWVNNIIRKTSPAVVGICVGDTAQSPPWLQGWEVITPAGRRSVGSGVIVDPRGYVITTYHVISFAGNIVVSLFDSKGYKDYPARIAATKKENDLALLEIVNPGGRIAFPYVPLGDSRKVAVGDKVIAIGNPYGLPQTVTGGIVSARRRRIPIDGIILRNVLQTDVPINPGNSGGALLNLHGELIGINTAIYSPEESVFTGISFAIPINQAKIIFSDFLDPPARANTHPVVWSPGNQPVQQGPGYRYIAATGPGPMVSPLDGRIQPSPGEGIEARAWLGIAFVPEYDADTTVREGAVDEVGGRTRMEAGLRAVGLVGAGEAMWRRSAPEFRGASVLGW